MLKKKSSLVFCLIFILSGCNADSNINSSVTGIPEQELPSDSSTKDITLTPSTTATIAVTETNLHLSPTPDVNRILATPLSLPPIDESELVSVILVEQMATADNDGKLEDERLFRFIFPDSGDIVDYREEGTISDWSPSGDYILLNRGIDILRGDTYGRNLELLFQVPESERFVDSWWLSEDVLLYESGVWPDEVTSNYGSRIWYLDIVTGENRMINSHPGSMVMTVSSTGTHWIEYGQDGTMRVYDIEGNIHPLNMENIRISPFLDDSEQSIVFRPGTNDVVFINTFDVGSDGGQHLCYAELTSDGFSNPNCSETNDIYQWIQASPDGEYLAYVGIDAVHVMLIDTFQEVLSFDTGVCLMDPGIIWAPNSAQLAVWLQHSWEDEELLLLDITSGETEVLDQGHGYFFIDWRLLPYP